LARASSAACVSTCARRRLLRKAPPLETTFHRQQQQIAAEGFGDEVVGAFLQSLHRQLDGGVAGDDRRHDVGVALLDDVQQVDPFAVRHHDVEQHQVEVGGLDGGAAGGDRTGRLDPVTFRLEHAAAAVADALFVVDHQHAAFGFGHGRFTRSRRWISLRRPRAAAAAAA
jgi:hypothetical protein